MNLCVPRSMPLAQATTGVGSCQMRRQRGRRLAQILRRHRQQYDIGARGLRDVAGHVDAGFEADAGQPQIFVGRLHPRHAGRAAPVEHDAASGARGDAGQRRAPGAGADHGD